MFLVDSKDEAWSLDQLNVSLGCYALYLATGNTIYCRSIKANTIDLYLKAAAGLIQQLDPICDRNALLAKDGNKYIGITRVLQEVRRIETVADRREAYTIAMHRRLYEQQLLAAEDSLERVLYQWFTCALQGGFRRSEWCQEDGAGLFTKIQMSAFRRAMAFILDDISFHTATKIELTFETVCDEPDVVQCVKVRFMWQKNKNHNIIRWFYRNDAKKYLCAVRSWIAIVKRFVRLMGPRSQKPLAIYKSRNRGLRLVTADVATEKMRSLAVDVHQLTKDADIKKFSCHSLRVGACCIYFATGYQPDFIQRVLRWDSDAWRTYVRNLVVTAMEMVVAVNKADDMPLM